METLDPDLLKTFLAFVDGGSLARAASAVGRSPSAVTAQMQRLEEIVGEPLLSPQGRGRGLTPAGEDLVGHARRILAVHTEAWLALKGARALQRQPGLGVDGKNAPRMADKVLTGRRQAAPPALGAKQRLADDFFQALHLCGDRRGRAANSRRRPGQRAAVDKSQKGFEQVGIKRFHNSILSKHLSKTIRFF